MRIDLVFEGVDTFATVRVNGQVVGRCADQHVGYRWDISDVLVVGSNRVEVDIESALVVGEAAERAAGVLPRPVLYRDPYPYVRKMACNFGWDWGPRLVTAGLWRPVRLETWGPARVVGVRPRIGLVGAPRAPERAVVDVHVDVELVPGGVSSGELQVRAELVDPGGVGVAEGVVGVGPLAVDRVVVPLVVEDPVVWWPVGLGDQPLYRLVSSVLVDGRVVATDSRRIGLRTVELDESVDERGAVWALRVNGRRVRVRGYNWIPDLPFPNEVTAERVAQRLDQAVAGGANLVRVWGGGHFPFEDFLDGCDERGLLVWQDFLFACAAYREDRAMVANVRREAEQAVTRMASHPCVVLWCGGNECVWGWYDWGWRETLQGRAWGARYYTEVLPEVVDRLDPTRPYLPNTPWSGALDQHPQVPSTGPVHLWEVWNHLDWSHYRDWDPRFVTEMGWCAPATYATMRRAVPQGDLGPGNPAVRHHLRALNGIDNLARGVAMLGEPVDGDGWLYLTQVAQARALTAGVEWLRSRQACAGVVVWQLNDCWPALSWSVVDVDGLVKPAWFAVRRAFSERLLTVQPATVGVECSRFYGRRFRLPVA